MTSATPNLPDSSAASSASVKEATPEYIVERQSDLDEIDVGIVDLLFEQISAQEIITMSRSDTVNGQTSAYQPIKNLSQLAAKYGPQSIVPVQNSSKAYFDNFPIKLEAHIPNQGNGLGGTHVYVDSNNSIVIEIVGLASDEQLELQILSSGEIINDTIY